MYAPLDSAGRTGALILQQTIAPSPVLSCVFLLQIAAPAAAVAVPQAPAAVRPAAGGWIPEL